MVLRIFYRLDFSFGYDNYCFNVKILVTDYSHRTGIVAAIR